MRRAALAVLLSGCAAVVGIEEEQCYLEPGVSVGAPCRLVTPQCGCDEGFACRSAVGCQPAGTRGVGEDCTVGANECVAGADCFTIAGASRCRAFCNAHEQCAAAAGRGSLCLRGDTEPVGLCTDSCAPGRGDCGPGGACFAVSTLSACIPAGTRVLGELCDDDVHCQDGLYCQFTLDGARRCFTSCGPDVVPCVAPTICQVPVPDQPGVVRDPAPDEWGICAILSSP